MLLVHARQIEMERFASAGNTLLVAPTGCGKTKVISMVLDALWRKKPSAKVSHFAFMNFALPSDCLSRLWERSHSSARFVCFRLGSPGRAGHILNGDAYFCRYSCLRRTFRSFCSRRATSKSCARPGINLPRHLDRTWLLSAASTLRQI